MERAKLLPGTSAGYCGFRPRMHTPRRSAADGHHVRFAICDLARDSVGAVSQATRKSRNHGYSPVAPGEKKQGVIGLFQPGLPGEVPPSLSVRFMGINHKAIASYLISLYCSIVVLTHDALGVLENVHRSEEHTSELQSLRHLVCS